MKTSLLKKLSGSILMMVLISTHILAQKTGSGNVSGNNFEVAAFTGVNVGGAFNVVLIQADEYQVYVETDDNLFNEISVDVKDGVLHLSSKNIRKATKLEAIVSAPEYHFIEASGAAKVEAETVLSSEMLRIKASGASNVALEIVVDVLKTDLSGASRAKLWGKVATIHQANMSGASRLLAQDLETAETSVKASGASNANVFALHKLSGSLSGASKVHYDHIPDEVQLNDISMGKSPASAPSNYEDSVNVKVGNLNIKVIDGDSTVVVIGNNKIVVDENGNVNLQRKKSRKFNGHWAGFDLGINGLLTPNFDFDYLAGDEYFDMRHEKSIAVNLNFYEQNIPLNKKGTFGLVSGLGLSWNNFRFANDVMLGNENNQVVGYYMEGVNVRKSKLTNTYLTLPLFMELQTASGRKNEKAHIAVGVVAGWRFSSHTKIYFNESGKNYNLIDPLTGAVVGSGQSPNASSRNIVKDHNSFQQNPFKLDASVRAGWGIVNLFANYSLTPLFTKNRGPELYPFAVGLTLSTW